MIDRATIKKKHSTCLIRNQFLKKKYFIRKKQKSLNEKKKFRK